jgi:hypothetical protein
MAKGSRFVDIKKTPRTINNWRLVEEELEARASSMHRIVSYLAAKEAFDMLMTQIPGGADYKDLRQSLRLSEVGAGKKGKEAAYAIHVPMKSRRVRKIDVPKTVIYVRAKKLLNKPDPAVMLLEDKGPWTADTIPFWPSKREASVVQRKVTKKEADKVAKMQKPNMGKIRAELLDMGRRVKKKKPGDPGHIKRGSKAIPDVAMQALDLEFGTAGGPSRPVFRKTIRRIKKGIRRLPAKHRIITQAMFDPNSKSYKSYPPRMKKISSSEASKFAGFQKRLGY